MSEEDKDILIKIQKVSKRIDFIVETLGSFGDDEVLINSFQKELEEMKMSINKIE